MELRAFWVVLLRWKWVVIAVVAGSIVASGALAFISPPGYKAQALISFSAPPPGPNVQLPGFDEQNRFLYSEGVVEDFTKIVAAPVFNEGVAKRVNFPVNPLQLGKSWTAKKQANHLLSLEISAPTEQKAVALAHAAAEEISLNGGQYYKALNTPELGTSVLDPGTSEGLTGRLVDILFVVGRVVVGIVVGLGLAFLLDYLDDHVNSPAEAEALGFRVIGSIPRATGHRLMANGSSIHPSNGVRPTGAGRVAG